MEGNPGVLTDKGKAGRPVGRKSIFFLRGDLSLKIRG